MLAMIRANRPYPRFIFCRVCNLPVKNLKALVKHSLKYHFGKNKEEYNAQAQPTIAY